MGEWWSNQPQNADHYYKIRERFRNPEGLEPWVKAAHFYWLKCHAHSGVVRYGPKGWNTPYGKGRAPTYAEDKIEIFYQHFEGRTMFTHNSFTEVLASCGEGDLVYCDPPYTPLKANGFAKYWKGAAFAEEEHRALVEAAQGAASRGAVVMISNHRIDSTLELYKDAEEIVSLEASRSVSSTASRSVPELVAIYRKEEAMNPDTPRTKTNPAKLSAVDEISAQVEEFRRRQTLEAVQNLLGTLSTKKLTELLAEMES
jgi:DNA adenine methylase